MLLEWVAAGPIPQEFKDEAVATISQARRPTAAAYSKKSSSIRFRTKALSS
jgi:hypothetical protein